MISSRNKIKGNVFKCQIFLVALLSLSLSSVVAADPVAYIDDMWWGNIIEMDAKTNTEMPEKYAGGNPLGVRQDGQHLYSISHAGLAIFDTTSKELITTLSGSRATSLAVHPTSDLMYLGRWNSDFIEVIDTNTYSVVASIPLGNTVDPRLVEVEQNPATNILVVRSGFMSNSILTIINTLTNTVIETIPTPGAYASSSKFAIDPTGSKLYFTNLQGLGVFDIATATLIQTLPLSPRANNIELSSSGELAYIDHDNGIYIVDINTMTVTDNVIVTDNDPYYNTNSMALHPNGEQAYLAGYGYLSGVGYQGVVYIVDLTSKSLVDTITFDGSYFGRIIFGPILETVGGSVTGMTPASIECQNNSTGQIVSIAPDGEASWDCESAGLTVDSGDSISISVSGSAK